LLPIDRPDPVKTDTLFYRLFQDRPTLVPKLAGIDLPPGAAYRLCAEEIKETAFRLDGLLIPEDPTAGLPLIFLEVQFQPDDAFYARWFAEIYLYLYRRQILTPWRAVVLYPRRETEVPAPPAYRTALENPWVHRVYLHESLADRPDLPPGLALVRLILETPEASAPRARDLIDNAGSERDWILDWVETILVYKFPKLTREEIRIMLDLKDPELRNTRFFQDVYLEGQLEGRDEAREEGRRREAAFVLRLVRRRLANLPAGTEERIAALPIAALESLGEALLDFAGPADLADWLDRRA
jgi:predicted transposase/invertase (TIGR01784 family)